MSSGRESILDSLAKARRTPMPALEAALPVWTGDPLASFVAKAKVSGAQPHRIPSLADAPAAIAEILRLNNAPPELHVAPESSLRNLAWEAVPALAISSESPSGDQSAVSAADFGIAETGTLVFFSGPNSRASWHFLPGREFILIEKSRILPRFEDVIERMSTLHAVPATVNLITGPSRTADIEQTIELGAHGPRELHILIAG